MTVIGLFRKIPFLRILLFFGLGCLSCSFGYNIRYVLVLVISAAMFLLLHFLISKQKDESQFSSRWFYGLSLGSFLFAFGMLFAHQNKNLFKSDDANYYVGLVRSNPQVSRKSVRCVVSLSKVIDDAKKSGDSFEATVFFPNNEASNNLKIGDSLMISGASVSAISRNADLELDENPSMFYLQDGFWSVISKSDKFQAVYMRDSLISDLKKKEYQSLN